MVEAAGARFGRLSDLTCVRSRRSTRFVTHEGVRSAPAEEERLAARDGRPDQV